MSWQIDQSHSQITFSVRHMMISNVHGRFENFTGEVDFNEADPTRSTVDVRIEPASINTRDPKRDGHLRSPISLTRPSFRRSPSRALASKSLTRPMAGFSAI